MQLTNPFKIVVALILVFSSLIGYLLSWSGMLFAFLFGVFSILLILLLFIRLISQKPVGPALTLIGILWGGQVIGIAFNLMKPVPDPLHPNPESSAHAIEYMYNTNNIDRQMLKNYIVRTEKEKMTERDSIRIQQVLKYHEEQQLNRAEEKYRAARILLHGTELEHYRLSYELASEAASLNPDLHGAERIRDEAHERWRRYSGM